MQFPEFESWNIPSSEDTILKSGFPQRELPQAPFPASQRLRQIWLWGLLVRTHQRLLPGGISILGEATGTSWCLTVEPRRGGPSLKYFPPPMSGLAEPQKSESVN